VQPHVFGYPTVVGIEVLVVPLEPAAGCSLSVLPVVVDPHGDHVFPVEVEVRGEVEAYGHDTVLVQSYVFAVEVEIGALPHTLELDEYLLPFGRFRQFEVFPVPCDGVGHFFYGYFECFVFVEGSRESDFFPILIGKSYFFGPVHIAYMQKPLRIEVILFPHTATHRQGERQAENNE